ncbi:hypothetical protein [Pseudomonas sp. 34 E 7]|nr:hypothetical protein [Pseudomonas sp. 34 E 7]
MTASGPTRMLCRSRSKCGRGLAPDGGLRADQDAGSDRVHIRFCGHGCLGFRPDGGSLLKSAKVSKTLLPHHSAPRLGSVCPLSGLNPWAAAMGHPWPSAANPASCRVTHGFKPAFGQRGLTGRLRSRSKAARFASWLRWATELCGYVRQLLLLMYRYRGQAPSHILICILCGIWFGPNDTQNQHTLRRSM